MHFAHPWICTICTCRLCRTLYSLVTTCMNNSLHNNHAARVFLSSPGILLGKSCDYWSEEDVIVVNGLWCTSGMSWSTTTMLQYLVLMRGKAGAAEYYTSIWMLRYSNAGLACGWSLHTFCLFPPPFFFFSRSVHGIACLYPFVVANGKLSERNVSDS